MRLILKTLGLLSSVGLTACANLNSTFVNPTVESPIVGTAKSQFNLGFGSLPAHEYRYTSDASLRPPNLTPDVGAQSSPFADGVYGFTDDLQVGLEIHPFNSGIEPKVKYQFLGDKSSGLQATVHGRAGITSTEKDGDQNGEFGPGGYKWEASSFGTSGSLGASLGYFLHESILVYGGGSFGLLKARGKIDHKLSDNGSSPAQSYRVDDDAKLTSLGLGVTFGQRTRLTLAVTNTQVDYKKLPVRHDNQYTILIGF